MKSFSMLIPYSHTQKLLLVFILPVLAWVAGCKGFLDQAPQYMYVAMPQATLRDSTAAVYSKIILLQNGERVQVLDHDRGFVKVRSAEGLEGWVERRFLVGQDIYNSFVQLASFHARDQVVSHGSTRDDVNMHITPSREAEKLYQLKQGEKIEMLARVSTPRVGTATGRNIPAATAKGSGPAAESGLGAQPNSSAGSSTEPNGTADLSSSTLSQSQPVQSMEDWWLVRDVRGHVGWIVGRLIAVDVPIAIAEGGFAQGQRPVATFVLNTITDPSINGPDKRVPFYLMLFTENRDGLPYDYDHVRVFVWNMRRSPHRYDLAYYEHGIAGVLPVKVSKENFAGEGEFPVFTLHVKTDSGQEERAYKLEGTSVKRVLASEERIPANPSEHQ